MAETKKDDKKKEELIKAERKFELIDEEGVFKDMYVRDVNIERNIKRIAESRELKELIKKAKKFGRSIDLLNDVVEEDQELPVFKTLWRTFKVFKADPEYSSKEAYLAYLKSAYKFMMIPLEEPPGLWFRLFYPTRSAEWKPSPEEARELLEKFFIETKLIRELPKADWEKVKKSKDPEVVLNNLLYGIKFKREFEGFLQNIPWIISRDRYGAPALDLFYWRAPGTEIPQKPIAVDDDFIDELIEGVSEHQAYARIEIDDKFIELKSRKQIEERLKIDERVLIDSYVGVSKIERDFVLHKRLILWRNPGYERYEKESKVGKKRGAKPEPYLVLLQEKAQHLEIPFVTVEPMASEKKKKDR